MTDNPSELNWYQLVAEVDRLRAEAARVRAQVTAELDLLRAQVAHFRDEWTIEGDSTWLWLDRILAGEQGCVLHATAKEQL